MDPRRFVQNLRRKDAGFFLFDEKIPDLAAFSYKKIDKSIRV